MAIISKMLTTWLNRIFPSYITSQIIFELGALRSHNWSYFKLKIHNKYKGGKNKYLNIGAGDEGKEGWINIDAFYHKGISLVWDCRKSLPFDDSSVNLIFTEHFFEHLDYETEAIKFLQESYRVLSADGIIRIIVPDAEKYIKGYCTDSWENLIKIRPLKNDKIDYYSGKKMNTKLQLINTVFRQHYQHKYAYDFDTLNFILMNAGFKLVIKQSYKNSLNPALLLDMSIRASESLYIEATK